MSKYRYTVTVHNESGASDMYSADTIADCKYWVSNWADPENLSAGITDHRTGIITHIKPRGKLSFIKVNQ